ncbi:MAG TPA: adenosylcobinamide-phosphate synthase CbiB, partial [Methylomirabilota bacterium]|nr:adenosylcobinamide-phosphate synthase CbiB [Methylomirabilota bacterium]
AVTLDLLLGDPPNRLHPVAWMGRGLAAGRRGLCRGPTRLLLVSGGALTLAVTALAAAAGALVTGLATALGPAGLVVEAVAVKTTISPRGLATAARSVAAALGGDALDEARARLALHLVSRPTAGLGAGEIASGAVESVAENLTDAIVAPIVFFLVLGVPGALAYRALNTADTMLGYRDGALEHFGKLAARLDDVANLLPARLAALALVVAAGGRARAAWSAMRRDHARTASPNAGWTMSAMAGALGVTLTKANSYSLGQGPLPGAADVERSVRIVGRAATIVVAALVVLHALLISVGVNAG